MNIAVFVFLFAQDAAGPEFPRFELSRERIRNRVIVDAELRNRLGVDLEAPRLTLVFFDGDREVRRSHTAHLPRLAAGGSVPVKIETEHVEKFGRLEALLESGDRRFVYEGRDLAKPPVLRAPPPPRLETRVRTQTRAGEELRAVVELRNLGVARARETGLLLAFEGSPAPPLHVRVPDVEAASEDVIEVVVPSAPPGAVRATAVCAVADIPCPPDPLGAINEVEVGRCRLVRLSDGTIRITGTLRNGRPSTVEKVVVEFRVGGVTRLLEAPEPLAPGAQRQFELVVAGAGAVEGYTYAMSYGETSKPAGEGIVRGATARRTSTRALAGAETGAAVMERLTVQVRGLRWEKGPPRGKKAADVAFLRIAVRDRAGQPAHPTGRFAARVGDAAVVRTIGEEAWAKDVDELAGKARPESVAYDPIAGELWIGLVRPEAPGAALRIADVALSLDGAGAWSWPSLAEPFQVEARGPDR